MNRVREWPDLRSLLALYRRGATYDDIATKLHRTPGQIAGKCQRLIIAGRLRPRGNVGGWNRTTQAELTAAGLRAPARARRSNGTYAARLAGAK